MDPNWPIIDKVLKYFPGNDIFFEGEDPMLYDVRVNYRGVVPVPRLLFNVSPYSDKLNREIVRITSWLFTNAFRGGLLNLHPSMCKEIVGDKSRILVNTPTTLAGNEIDINKPLYVVLEESDEPATRPGDYNTLTFTLKFGCLHEDEMPQYYPLRSAPLDNDLVVIKKR